MQITQETILNEHLRDMTCFVLQIYTRYRKHDSTALHVDINISFDVFSYH